MAGLIMNILAGVLLLVVSMALLPRLYISALLVQLTFATILAWGS
jgi:hypothetical protein